MNGIILIDKPQGKTSHDMVYFVRRLCGIRKVGHTGTLDPDATGVLPVCIGKATKVCDMLTVSDKEYIAEIAFGATTDTQDASGQVLESRAVTATEDEIRDAIEHFTGEIKQIPPMFSAIKQNGRKLCDLARQGITVERNPRRITVYETEILGIDMVEKTARFRVSCSKGTYIRTLCEDIGEYLGCGAHMKSLRRTKSGGFDISQCRTREELESLAADGRIAEAIIAADEVFSMLGKIVLEDLQVSKLKNGVRIKRGDLSDGARYRVYSPEGEFLSVARAENGELVSEKSFWS